MRKGNNSIGLIIGIMIALSLAVLLGKFVMDTWKNADNSAMEIMKESSECRAEIMRICLEKNSEGIAKMRIDPEDYCKKSDGGWIVRVDDGKYPEDGVSCPCIINEDTKCSTY